MDDSKSVRLYELALRALEGVIGDDEFSELSEELSGNPESLESYFELMTACAALHRDPGETIADPDDFILENPLTSPFWHALAEQERTAPETIIPKVELPRELVRVQKIVLLKRKVSKFQKFVLAASLAAVLTFVAYVQFVPVSRPAIGQLTDTYQARWSDTVDDVAAGEDLRPGYMELLSGFAHITLNSGARVIVKGPAQFELESEGDLFLQAGKLSCVVPPQAIGFTVGTPSATVVDFGTEFGVVVQESGRTEAHVFKGQVELRTGPDSVVFEESRRLGTGQGSTVDENENLLSRRFRARPEVFIRNELVPYEIAVRESNPFAYWRFDVPVKADIQNSPATNRTPYEFYGDVEIVPGPSLGKGKVGGAVQLDGSGSYVYIPKAGDRGQKGEDRDRDFSYSFWVRPNTIRAQDLITATNKGTQQYRHIGLDSEGRFSFFTYLFQSQVKKSEFYGNTTLQPQQWHHVVVTGKQIKGMKSEMCLYVNGRQDASQVVGATYAPRFYGHFHIGSVPEDGKVEGVHSFDGAITEVVEYDRALTPKEIQAIYSSAGQ